MIQSDSLSDNERLRGPKSSSSAVHRPCHQAIDDDCYHSTHYFRFKQLPNMCSARVAFQKLCNLIFYPKYLGTSRKKKLKDKILFLDRQHTCFTENKFLPSSQISKIIIITIFLCSYSRLQIFLIYFPIDGVFLFLTHWVSVALGHNHRK